MGEPEKGEPLLRELVAFTKKDPGPESSPYSRQLTALGANLLLQKKEPEAETLLRNSLEIGQKKEPDMWNTYCTQSLLGQALAAQEKYADAEPHLLTGYQGMKERQAKIPPKNKERLTQALERLVTFYDGTGKKAEADKWRKELDQQKAAKP
jgi:hypothetical protein